MGICFWGTRSRGRGVPETRRTRAKLKLKLSSPVRLLLSFLCSFLVVKEMAGGKLLLPDVSYQRSNWKYRRGTCTPWSQKGNSRRLFNSCYAFSEISCKRPVNVVECTCAEKGQCLLLRNVINRKLVVVYCFATRINAINQLIKICSCTLLRKQFFRNRLC